MPEDFVEVVSTQLCPSLSRAEAGSLVADTVPVGVPAQGMVFSEDEPGRGLFFFVSGRVEIIKRRRDGVAKPIGIVDAPSLLGDIALVIDGHRTATVRAVSHCEFRFLPKELFRRRLDAGDLAAHKLMGGIATLLVHRLLNLNAILLDMTAPGGTGDRAEEIERLREKLYSEWPF